MKRWRWTTVLERSKVAIVLLFTIYLHHYTTKTKQAKNILHRILLSIQSSIISQHDQTQFTTTHAHHPIQLATTSIRTTTCGSQESKWRQSFPWPDADAGILSHDQPTQTTTRHLSFRRKETCKIDGTKRTDRFKCTAAHAYMKERKYVSVDRNKNILLVGRKPCANYRKSHIRFMYQELFAS